MKENEETAHSADQFGSQRDWWWNADFLQMLARRIGVYKSISIADIGCGVGHWSSALLKMCPAAKELTCVDREELWVNQVEGKIRERSPEAKNVAITALKSDASRIDLPSERFDLVTCQTLLMHLANPEKAVSEMVRLCKQDGLIVVVEPNNFNNYFQIDSTSWSMSVEDHATLYSFWLYCSRGRTKQGLGNDAVGQILPGIMERAGLRDVEVCLSDKAYSMSPPYRTAYEQAWLKEAQQRPTTKEDAQLAELAKSGNAPGALITRSLELIHEQKDRMMEAVETSSYYNSGGSLMYIAWARKSA